MRYDFPWRTLLRLCRRLKYPGDVEKRNFTVDERGYGMKEVVVDSIMYDLVHRTPVVILKEMNSDRYLPILIGMYEASAIEVGLKNVPFPRPMTHDLLNHFLEKLQKSVEFIHITHIEASTFFATIVIYNEGEKIAIDARPSDAIALAIRTKSPILVSEEILTQAGIPLKAMKKPKVEGLGDDDPRILGGGQGQSPLRRGDDSSQFREFINNVTPEDFITELDDDLDINKDQ